MDERKPVSIIPTLSQWNALEANNLDLRKCTTFEDSPSALFHWNFLDNEVFCTTIHTDGTIDVEKRDLDPATGWTRINDNDGRCYSCDYLDDDLVPITHEDETVMVCKECAA